MTFGVIPPRCPASRHIIVGRERSDRDGFETVHGRIPFPTPVEPATVKPVKLDDVIRERVVLAGGEVAGVDCPECDFDGDALSDVVDQEGEARHTGYRSRFYRTIDDEITGERVLDPDDVYE